MPESSLELFVLGDNGTKAGTPELYGAKERSYLLTGSLVRIFSAILDASAMC